MDDFNWADVDNVDWADVEIDVSPDFDAIEDMCVPVD